MANTSVASEPIVIAHRGASGYVPEHTLVAKGMAHAMGADYLEQDVVLTKDNIPIVLHDIHLDTVSDVKIRYPHRARQDGRFYAIDFTLEEIKKLRVTERFSHRTGAPVFPQRFPGGVGALTIPTLAEELEFIQGINQSTGREAGIYPEIKHPAWHREQGYDPSRVVIALLRDLGYATKEDKCFLQCFDEEEVKRIRNELGWEGRLIQLMGGGSESLRTAGGLRELANIADGIGPALDLVVDFSAAGHPDVRPLVHDAHAAGLEIHPYTFRADDLPPGIPSFAKLLDLFVHEAHVDGLFTDHPDQAVAFLRSRDSTE